MCVSNVTNDVANLRGWAKKHRGRQNFNIRWATTPKQWKYIVVILKGGTQNMGSTDTKIARQTKSKERVRDFGEVFTKPETASDMLDLIDKEMFEPQYTFLEPCVGEGVFLLEVLRRKFANCEKRKDYTVALNSIWGMDIQADNVEITIKNILELCEQYFKPTKAEIEIVNWHIMQADSMKVMNMMNSGNEND